MKKYLHIPLAIALILLGIWGCFVNCPRILTDCLPEGQWDSVVCREQTLSLTTETVKSIMEDTVVSHLAKSKGPDDSDLTLLVKINGTTHLMELDSDGGIAIAELSNLEKTRTCWQDTGGKLFEKLSPSRQDDP